MKNKLYLFVILALSLSINSCELEPLHSALGVNFEVTFDCLTATFTTTAQGEQEWDFGDGNTSIAQNPTHQYQGAGQYEVSLIVRGGTGAGKSSRMISVNPEVETADFEVTTDCQWGIFTSTLQGELEWDFGDGTTSTKQNPIHEYTVNGNYEVILRSLSNDCSEPFSRAIQIASTSGNTFIQENTNAFSPYQGFFMQNSNGYLVAETEAPAPSIYQYSADGVRGELVSQGEFFFSPSSEKSMRITNDNGSIIYDFASSVGGVGFSVLEEENVFFRAEQIFLMPDELSVFTAGTYGETAEDRKGIFAWATSFGDFSKELNNPLNVQMVSTPDGGFMLGAITADRGIYITKLNMNAEQQWEVFLDNTHFVDNFQWQESTYFDLLALDNDEYIICTADGSGGLNSAGFGGIQPEAYIIRLNKTEEVWRKSIDETGALTSIYPLLGDNFIVCGVKVPDGGGTITPYLARFSGDGEVVFEREFQAENLLFKIPRKVLETDNGELLMMMNDLTFIQTDCAGNL